ncbi:DUF5723 family protein [Rhodohalobacter sp. 614A]|uniref:DUF5723 family protein n=1 Tax=Rhodohalobacter sp. 614A TaxID=2908649 RepID=UPI001F1891C1|nr:DUF5723 family protein [Rhodohalobacter sp. 614A]
MIFALAIPRTSQAQISFTTESMALGGGGTAYLTGFEALFVNPANLYIQEKNYRFQISVLQGGLYYDTLLPIPNSLDRYNHFTDQFTIFDAQSDVKTLESDDYESLLNRNYSSLNKTKREFLTEYDFYWFGLKWVRPKRSYALSLRTRFGSRYELGKGLFANIPVEKNNSMIVDRSFSQKTHILHEFSFGYAESFTYLNGLLPQLSEFIIGIAPKIVLAGSTFEADYTNWYEMDSESSLWNQKTAYTQQTSGILSGYGEHYFNNGSLPSQSEHSFNDLYKPAGIGIGLDIGVTYLITFGDDLSVLRQQNEPTEKSLRLSLSITDLGAVYQYKSPYQYTSETAEAFTSELESPSETVFTGAPNEHYLFLSQFDDFTNLTADSHNADPFDLLLPTSIQAGALFQYQAVKVVGDFSYSLSDTPFNHKGLASYIGVELRPVPYIPIRGGTRFAPEMSGYYSFGTGIETNHFDVNMSVLLKSRKIGPTQEILGFSLLGLKFYFQ